MKKYFLMMLLLLNAVLSGCGEESSPPGQKQGANISPGKTASPQVRQNPNAGGQPALSGNEKQPWPFIKSESGDRELAANLTAKNYLLVFDGSGSMNGSECSAEKTKIEAAKAAVAEWSKTLPEDANLGIVAFSQSKWASLPLTGGKRENFIRFIKSLNAGGTTPLTEAFEKAYKELTRQGQSQLGYGEYTIVSVTDGYANDPDSLAQWVRYILSNSPITIYTIGFCIGKDHSLNQPGYTIYKAADNPDELRQGLKEVLAESEIFDESDF
jgi:Ca-activated chloride channel homolog